MFGVIEGVGAFHLSQNSPKQTRLQFLNHPGVSLLRRNRMGGLEALWSGRDKTIPGVIARMTEDKNQADAHGLQPVEPVLDQFPANSLLLVI